jgi:hypothetical protein
MDGTRLKIMQMEWQQKLLELQAEDLQERARDVQLMRISKPMREAVFELGKNDGGGGIDGSGGGNAVAAKFLDPRIEISALEKMIEHVGISHSKKLTAMNAKIMQITHDLESGS